MTQTTSTGTPAAPQIEVLTPEPAALDESAAFAQVLRKQLPRLQPVSAYLGAIQSIEFQGVGNQGWDVYDVQREHGSSRWRIALGSDGKILGALVILTSPAPVNLGP
jgi:hypothetical protein